MKNNLLYKIFAVVATLIIWLQVNLLRDQTAVLDIPLKIYRLPDNLYIYKADELKVPITISGRGINILMYYWSNPSILYNGNDLDLNNRTLDLDVLSRALPQYLDLKFSIASANYLSEINLDVIVNQRVPVVYDFYSERDRERLLDNNFIFDELSITISGPSQEVSKISEIYTEKIRADIINATEQFVRLVNVNEHIVLVPSSIELLNVSDIISSRTMPFINIIHDEDIVIFPQRVTVIIEGKLDSLQFITSSDIQAYISPDPLKDSDDAEIYFRKPDFVKIIDYTPKRVTIQKKDR